MGFEVVATPEPGNAPPRVRVDVDLSGRTNLAANPALGTGTAGWVLASGVDSLSRTSTVAVAGTWSALFTLGSTRAGNVAAVAGWAIVGGGTYTVSLYVRPQVERRMRLIGRYRTGGSGGTEGPSTPGEYVTCPVGQWTRLHVTYTVGPSADYPTVSVQTETSMDSGAWLRADALLVEEGAALGAYFDGDAPGAAWTGAAHGSTSVIPDEVPGSVDLWRQDPDGRLRPVRGAGPLPLSGGVAVLYDYEAPFGAPVRYRAVTGDGLAVGSDAVTLDVDTIWLRHPMAPALSREIAVERVVAGSWDQRTRASRRAVFHPLGRALPVVVTQGQRHGPESVLLVRTDTLAELDALRAVLDDETPLLLSVPPGLRWGVTHEWIAVGDVVERREVSWGAHEGRVVEMPYVVVDAPAGAVQPERTWATLAAEYPSWAAAAADYESWIDAATGSRRA